MASFICLPTSHVMRSWGCMCSQVWFGVGWGSEIRKESSARIDMTLFQCIRVHFSLYWNKILFAFKVLLDYCLFFSSQKNTMNALLVWKGKKHLYPWILENFSDCTGIWETKSHSTYEKPSFTRALPQDLRHSFPAPHPVNFCLQPFSPPALQNDSSLIYKNY